MKQLRLTTIAMLITLCLLLACDPGLPSTVTYDGNGADSGDVPVDAGAYNQYDAVTVTDGQGSLVKAGYNLAGWMTAVDGTGTSYAAGTVFAMGAENVTLFAVWVSSDFMFESSSTCIRLTKYNGPSSAGVITIPAGVTDLGFQTQLAWAPGSTIGVFSDFLLLTSVSLPPSLVAIGNFTFYGCSGIAGLTLPSSIEVIGAGAFFNCTGLASITIPAAVTSIGQNAFFDCTSLATVTIMPTTPPALGADFSNLPTGYQLRVPVGTVATYQAATNWSTWAANIVSQ